MKRLLLIAACLAFLAGCTKEDNEVRQKANLATKATQAHLNIQFMSFGNTLNFYIPEWDRYELTRVAITLYNVYIWPGAESPPIFNTSTWQYVTSQVIIAEASLSENALIHLQVHPAPVAATAVAALILPEAEVTEDAIHVPQEAYSMYRNNKYYQSR